MNNNQFVHTECCVLIARLNIIDSNKRYMIFGSYCSSNPPEARTQQAYELSQNCSLGMSFRINRWICGILITIHYCTIPVIHTCATLSRHQLATDHFILTATTLSCCDGMRLQRTLAPKCGVKWRLSTSTKWIRSNFNSWIEVSFFSYFLVNKYVLLLLKLSLVKIENSTSETITTKSTAQRYVIQLAGPFLGNPRYIMSSKSRI